MHQMPRTLVAGLASWAISPCLAVDPIIAGQGAFRYQYEPSLLQMPSSSVVQHSHGLAVDDQHRIYLTYVPGDTKDVNCLVRWQPNGTEPELLEHSVCKGTPHGLRLSKENGKLYLYHANNAAALHKTTLEGEPVWSVEGPPGNNAKWMPYKPTWFTVPPNSSFAYLADGYGSSYIHVFNKTSGMYTGRTFGGKGKAEGKFSCPHGINFDPRRAQLVVSDRSNHRHQYFSFTPDETTPTMEYRSQFAIKELQAPCTMHFEQETQSTGQHAIVPDLNGDVGILNADNKLVSLLKVNELLGHKGFKHPHDAMFLPNGDLVVCTWNPGRISYWRRLPADDTGVLVV